MNNKFKVGILDDEPNALTMMDYYIKDNPEFEVAFLEGDPIKAIELAMNTKLDLLITDIHMPVTNGIWVAQQMIDLNIPVAITSGVWESAHMCINMNIVGFIHKPISKKGIEEILTKYKSLHLSENSNPSKSSISTDLHFIKTWNPLTLHAINPNDILYIKGSKDYAEIYFSSDSPVKKILHRITLNNIIKSIQSPFLIRVQKSYVINTQKIKKCDYFSITLEGNVEVPLGETYLAELLKFLESRTL